VRIRGAHWAWTISYLDHWEERLADMRIHGTTKRQVAAMFALIYPMECEEMWQRSFDLFVIESIPEGHRQFIVHSYSHNDSPMSLLNTYRSSVRCALAGLLSVMMASAQQAPVDLSNWGSITTPIYGTSESGVYSGAELFAGPNKFGAYYAGVLPNGRKVTPAGTSLQVGMNPLGLVLTPDGKYAITSNDDEREAGFISFTGGPSLGGYSLSVIDTNSMTVVSQVNSGKFFIGLQATGTGPYTLWASGGPDNDVKIYSISATGMIAPDPQTPKIVIKPILPANAGYVSNYTPDPALNTADPVSGFMPPVPTGFSRTTGAQITFPAGSGLSPDGKFLYVACNGDNSVAVIDTTAKTVVKQLPAGYFPYTVAVSPTGTKIAVTNWGVTEYKFFNPQYSATGLLTDLGMTPNNQPAGYSLPSTSTSGNNPQTSSVSLYLAPAGNAAALTGTGAIYQGARLDDSYQVGDTHPSATAIVSKNGVEVLYVAKSNSDALGVIVLNDDRKLKDFDLSPISFMQNARLKIHGSYPNALAVSPDNTRLYVAEAGLNSVAVLNVSTPAAPKLLGRIPTGWYPTGVAVSPDGKTLFVINAKGIGEDINPNAPTNARTAPSTGVISTLTTDSNYIFGSIQKIPLGTIDNTTVLANDFAIHQPADTSVVPAGGGPSSKITHVFFILHENKTFDSMLGNQGGVFGNFASTTYYDPKGNPYTNGQYTGVALNTQALATTFATAVNYYSESEESDAGHQFCMSGTATDYTEKTLLVKSGRGILVNKNFEPEDYPEAGYIFNNAARNGVSFKEYGVIIRLAGSDTGTSTPTTLGDPASGLAGYPQLQSDDFSVTKPLKNAGDVTSETQGLGQSYFTNLGSLAILGGTNASGEPRIDPYYPGYNFNISDQRRAQEFIADFDGMVAAGTLPQFVYIYQPNDHTGGVQAPNAKVVGSSPLQQIADGDTALGMVVSHIMNSPVYYDPTTGQGSAIFITYDDAQSSIDHIHPHRTPLIVVSPYAKPGYIATRHYSTASIVKTEELLLGLPPANLGDLLATDLRDMFQSTYNGLTEQAFRATRPMYRPTTPGLKIWELANQLDNSGPDKDSARFGILARLSKEADDAYKAAGFLGRLSPAYRKHQRELLDAARKLVNAPARDLD
jgi:YVTN family beta-propeller protein